MPPFRVSDAEISLAQVFYSRELKLSAYQDSLFCSSPIYDKIPSGRQNKLS